MQAKHQQTSNQQLANGMQQCSVDPAMKGGSQQLSAAKVHTATQLSATQCHRLSHQWSNHKLANVMHQCCGMHPA
jgi:hypothetical protein